MQKVYQCWVQGCSDPKKVHKDKEEAQQHARILATQPKNLGRPVHLLESIQVITAETPPVTVSSDFAV